MISKKSYERCQKRKKQNKSKKPKTKTTQNKEQEYERLAFSILDVALMYWPDCGFI